MHLASFTSHICEVHPHCCTYQCPVPFCPLNSVPSYKMEPHLRLSIHQLMDILDCFQLGAVMNNAMNSHGNLSVPLCCHFPWADSWERHCWVARWPCVWPVGNGFPKRLHYFRSRTQDMRLAGSGAGTREGARVGLYSEEKHSAISHTRKLGQRTTRHIENEGWEETHQDLGMSPFLLPSSSEGTAPDPGPGPSCKVPPHPLSEPPSSKGFSKACWPGSYRSVT